MSPSLIAKKINQKIPLKFVYLINHTCIVLKWKKLGVVKGHHDWKTPTRGFIGEWKKNDNDKTNTHKKTADDTKMCSNLSFVRFAKD